MFVLNEDNSIYATRGDIVFFSVCAEDKKTGVKYTFKAGDVLRIKVYGKKDAESVYLQKDFPVVQNTSEVEIFLTEEDTKIGDVISKPTDYWYEVELNPDEAPQTIIGYNDEDGAVIFKLFPEGADVENYEPDPEDFPVVDEELDMNSPRPVSNRVIARAFANLKAGYEACHDSVAKLHVTPQMFGAVGDGVADDTEAIQRCINESDVVFLPNGSYRITAPLEVPYGKTIMGNNKYYTKIICDNCDAIHFEERAERGNIKGISFWGDKSEHSIFVFNNNAHLTFNDVWARNFGGPYFYANNCGHNNNIIIENSEFEWGSTSCIEMIHAAGSQINNITIRSCNISGFEKGICITGNNITITACTIQDVEFGIYIDPTMSKDLTASAHNSRAININSNYFELVKKSFVYINSYYDASNTGFISGISIVSNYGAPHRDADTSYPGIKFDTNNDIYSSYRLEGGSMIAAVFYASNHFEVNGGKVLIDGAGILPVDCVFITDGRLGNNENYSPDKASLPYTLQNMGNATVINKFAYTVSPLKMYDQRLPEGATVTLDSVRVPINGEVFCNIPNDRIVSIKFAFRATPSTNYHFVKIKGHLKSGEVIDVSERYVKTTSADANYEWVVDGGNWGYANNVKRSVSEFDSFDIYIKVSPTEDLTIINPVVTKGGVIV